MKRAAVESSSVVPVGYDAETRELEVEFKGGAVYLYADVPAEKHAAMTAPGASIGTVLARQIKPHFACRRLGSGGQV